MEESTGKLCRIKDYFSGRSVLLTGGTGFIGMALIEGLLSASPDLGRVFVLVREKRGMSPEERVARLLSSEIFAHLSAEALAKVVPVVGELTAENLGLSAAVLAQIRDSVSVVIHNAGLIKFNRTLAEAVQMNVLSTLRCIDLAKSLHHLSAFIYSSTVLANSNVAGRVREEVYKTNRSPREMIQLALETPSSLNRIPEFKEAFIEGHISSYTFTKQLAENLILEEMAGLPVGIIRPSLVHGFYEHRIPGWFGSSQSGHCNCMRGHVKGIARTCVGYPDTQFTSVPCDYVVKAALCLVVFLSSQSAPQNKPTIVHLTSTRNANPLTNQQFCDILNEESWKSPCDSYALLPRLKLRNGWRMEVFFLWLTLFHVIMYIPERVFKLSPKWMRGFRMLSLQYNSMKFFKEHGIRESDYCLDNSKDLLRQMHPDDIEKYSFDIDRVNWRKCLAQCLFWARKSYYRDSGSVTWMHRVVQYLFLGMECLGYLTVFKIVKFLIMFFTGSLVLSTTVGLFAALFAYWL
ncbi:putative fatty acyl-CoA reductase CG8303 [Phlebotomus argentipes]|uniref:putative fatty acyl-CoA reductase CG8303 n=1 Tax=Phlebotomus argentipes TaxID=94469 RepID=UPI0028934B06|nr:putative fatty acyl-CoA reductase CG8303 [Phlebotomus argentipes]